MEQRPRLWLAALGCLTACSGLRVEECQLDQDCPAGERCNTALRRCEPGTAEAPAGSSAASSRRAPHPWPSSTGWVSSSGPASRSSGATSGASLPASGSVDGGPAGSRRIFVTAEDHATALGGLTGADAFCARAATAAGLGGQWMAWLSDSTASVADRMAHHAGPYTTTTWRIVADDWRMLTGGALRAPVDRDQYGAERNRAVFTNTNPDGTTRSPADSCGNWTLDGVAGFSYAGLSSAADATWTLNGERTYPCGYAFALYCVEQ